MQVPTRNDLNNTDEPNTNPSFGQSNVKNLLNGYIFYFKIKYENIKIHPYNEIGRRCAMESKHLKFVRELESKFAGKKRSGVVGLINKYVNNHRFTEDDFIECFEVCVDKLPDFVTIDFLLNRLRSRLCSSKIKKKIRKNELYALKNKI